MSEWDDSVFDEVAERMEAEKEQKLNAGKNGYVEAQKINTLKNLRPYLCSIAVPHGHRGMPKVRECKNCQSQCAYGRRLIELVDIQIKSAAQAKTEIKARKSEESGITVMMPEEAISEAPNVCTVKLTSSQCQNVAEFIEVHLIDAIRSDVDLDNVAWIKDMILAMETLKKAGGYAR